MQEIETKPSNFARFIGVSYAIILMLILGLIVSYFIYMIASNKYLEQIHDFKPPYIPAHLDFVRFYASGLMVQSCDRTNIYDPIIQLNWINHVLAPAKLTSIYFMEHPPYVFLLTVPLTLFSLPIAHLVLVFFSSLVAIFGLWLFLKDAENKSNKYIICILLGVNASYIAWFSYFRGQLGMFLLGIVSCYWWSILKKKDTLSGITLALSTIKAQHIPFLILPLLAGKRWKALTLAAVVELVMLGISALWVGWKNIIFYPMLVCHNETSAWQKLDFFTDSTSIRGPLNIFFPKSFAVNITALICLIVLFALFMLWHHNLKQKQNLAWTIAITMISTCIFGIHTLLYDCSLFALAAGLTLPTLNPVSALKIKPMSFKIWCSMLVFYPLLSWILIIWRLHTHLNDKYFHTFMIIPNLIIFCAGIYYYFKYVFDKEEYKVN